MAGEENDWSPRQRCARGSGQTPLAVGSWDFYFCSEQSSDIEWMLKVTTDTFNFTQIKVQVFHLPTTPVKIERICCSLQYSAFDAAQRPEAPVLSRRREIVDHDIHVHPGQSIRWILVFEISKCNLSNVNRDVAFSVVFRKLTKDDAASSSPTTNAEAAATALRTQRPETPAELLTADMERLLTSERHADVEFVIEDGDEEAKGGDGGGVGSDGGDIGGEVANAARDGYEQSAIGNLTGNSANQLCDSGDQVEVKGLFVNGGDWNADSIAGNPANAAVDADSNAATESNAAILRAHKAVLVARVPYFERLFASGMAEAATNRIRVTDADLDSFRQFLRFVYAGKLPENVEEKPRAYLAIGEKYDVAAIKERCEEALKRKLERGNLVETLVWADLYRCGKLKEACLAKYEEWRGELGGEDLRPLKRYPELMFEILSFGKK